MPNYSITLNFLLPPEMVTKLNTVKIVGGLAYDWRKSGRCHCTVKALSLCDTLPEQEILDDWIQKIRTAVAAQSQFSVSVKNLGIFPNAIFAEVISEELKTLHHQLIAGLPGSQPQFEGTNYHPHVSLVMLRSDANIKTPMNQKFGAFTVRDLQLTAYDLNNLDNSKSLYTFILKSARK